jgi:hypothetical protein
VPKQPLLAAVALLAILIAIYGPGVGRGFVKDDVVWVGANHVASWQDARALLFRTDGFYRPLVAATFAIDRALYGVEPFGFGVTNVVLLLVGALALAYLARSLGLGPVAAVVAAGVWTLNFHAVNMAVLWLSGRTALCVAVGSFLAAAATVRKRPVAAGIAAFLAMLAKEEAVMLPLILGAWAWVLASDGPGGESSDTPGGEGLAASGRVLAALRLTWPSWVGLALYFALRLQTAAMTPMSASEPYRFVFTSEALLVNALEYADRACTCAVIVIAVAHLLARRRPALTPSTLRLMVLGAVWLVGTFALTIFLPSRSSLYALLPSGGVALIAGSMVQDVWSAAAAGVRTRLAVAAVVLPLALLPVYWIRNTRWTEIADLSAETFEAVRRVTRERPDVPMLIFRDDPVARRSFANAYDQLLPQAVALAAGRDIPVELETPSTATGGAVVIALKNRRVVVE